jgi:hypothetical protein
LPGHPVDNDDITFAPDMTATQLEVTVFAHDDRSELAGCTRTIRTTGWTWSTDAAMSGTLTMTGTLTLSGNTVGCADAASNQAPWTTTNATVTTWMQMFWVEGNSMTRDGFPYARQ